jgi:hypothetical protein
VDHVVSRDILRAKHYVRFLARKAMNLRSPVRTRPSFAHAKDM